MNYDDYTFKIRVLSRVREVECVYRLDESAMRLTILLPENYPIGAPKVETSRSIVSKDLERKWLLQLGVFLNRQIEKSKKKLIKMILQTEWRNAGWVVAVEAQHRPAPERRRGMHHMHVSNRMLLMHKSGPQKYYN